MHAVKLWPALQALDAHTLVHGRVLPWAHEPSAWWVEYANDFEQPLQEGRKREILAWLGLPADTRMLNAFE